MPRCLSQMCDVPTDCDVCGKMCVMPAPDFSLEKLLNAKDGMSPFGRNAITTFAQTAMFLCMMSCIAVLVVVNEEESSYTLHLLC